jgi:hypothetical protein
LGRWPRGALSGFLGPVQMGDDPTGSGKTNQGAERLQTASRLLGLVSLHAQDGCPHCTALLAGVRTEAPSEPPAADQPSPAIVHSPRPRTRIEDTSDRSPPRPTRREVEKPKVPPSIFGGGEMGRMEQIAHRRQGLGGITDPERARVIAALMDEALKVGLERGDPEAVALDAKWRADDAKYEREREERERAWEERKLEFARMMALAEAGKPLDLVLGPDGLAHLRDQEGE